MISFRCWLSQAFVSRCSGHKDPTHCLCPRIRPPPAHQTERIAVQLADGHLEPETWGFGTGLKVSGTFCDKVFFPSSHDASPIQPSGPWMRLAFSPHPTSLFSRTAVPCRLGTSPSGPSRLGISVIITAPLCVTQPSQVEEGTGKQLLEPAGA